jgi:peptide deformylase
MILELVPETDPILHNPVEIFDFENSTVDTEELVKNLTETMLLNDGVGISANQCGLPYRVFVMLNQAGVPFEAFNPVIVDEQGQALGTEGCLSFPGLSLHVKRATLVILKAQDASGKSFEKVMAGKQAVCALHETDHLNGITFTKRVSKLKLEMARNKVR